MLVLIIIVLLCILCITTCEICIIVLFPPLILLSFKLVINNRVYMNVCVPCIRRMYFIEGSTQQLSTF